MPNRNPYDPEEFKKHGDFETFKQRRDGESLRYEGSGQNQTDKLGDTPESADRTPKALEPGQLKDAEQAAEGRASTKPEDKEVDDTIGSGFREEGGKHKKRRSRFSRRQKLISGGIVGLLLGGTVGIFSILQGPFQFVHFAQILQRHFTQIDNMMDDQQLSRVRYQRRHGIVGNKAADIIEAKLNEAGFTSKYDSAGYFKGFIIDPARVKPDELRGLGAELDLSNPNEILLVENGANFKRRGLINEILGRADMGKVPSRISSRLLRTRGGVSFKLLGNVDRKIHASTRAYWDAVQKRFSEYVRSGNNLRVRASAADQAELTEEERAALQQEAGDFNQTLEGAGTDTTDGGIGKTTTDIEAGGKVGKATNIIGFVCAARAVGNAYQLTMFTRIILPLTRLGVGYMSIGHNVMSGKNFSVEELGAFSSQFYDKETQTSWTSARSIQYELGQKQTGPDMPPSSRPGRVGNKPAFFDAVDNIPGAKTACKVNDSTVGGLTISFFTGGFALDVVMSALQGVGIDPIGKGLEAIIRWSVGQPLKELPGGALLGNYANYGARLAKHDNFIAIGARQLSGAESKRNRRSMIQEEREMFAQLPLRQRLFDLGSYQSLVSRMSFQAPRSVPSAVNAIFGTIWSTPSVLADTLIPNAYAQELEEYDYTSPDFGYVEEELEKYADPYEVDCQVEGNLKDKDGKVIRTCGTSRIAEFNEEYGSCFSTTIDPDTKRIKSGETVNYYVAEFDKCRIEPGAPNYDEFRLWGSYIRGKVADKGVECYDGIEDSCNQVGYGDAPQQAPTSIAGNGIVGDIGESSESVACASGTNDLGVIQSRYRGREKKSNPLMIRLCQIPDIPGQGQNTSGTRISGGAVVNSRISGAWQALAVAAKQAGVPMGASSSFRLADSCGGTGDGTGCAEPGGSYHQLGVAIDIAMPKVYGGFTCNNRARIPSNATWQWLYKNAEAYGLKQYSHEAWHWDPANLPNRCGTAQ